MKKFKKSILLTAASISLGLTNFNVQSYAYDCSNLPAWDSTTPYNGGVEVQHNQKAYQANWWTQGNNPETHSGPWQEWDYLDDCGGSNSAPQITLTSPIDNTSFNVSDLVTLSANASDSDGSIDRVEFYLDSTLVNSDTTPPYSTTWTATSGSHSIHAIAYDNLQANTISLSHTITVTDSSNQPPQIEVSQPAAGTKEGQTIALTATASDTDGNVTQVEFFIDNQSVGIDTSEPFSVNWLATRGEHQLFATATDNQNANTNSVAKTFTVDSSDTGQPNCRPDGLYQTPNVNTPYCTLYDENGREKMGGKTRRVIGYFTSWRTGNNGPAYLANQIPWEQLTHINYAFAHVDANNKISVGSNVAANPATGMEWPDATGAEMDPDFSYKGHFNLLNKYKKQYPNVKTLISVGGWAETGGYFDDNGDLVLSGGFYTMTTNSDGSVNQNGIDTFANSAVEFIRQYGFDGVDIDYEYATSMNDAGNPNDFPISNALRGGLNASYVVLMKTLREKLDMAGQQDGIHYMLTVAAPSSGYLLRGMEVYESAKYLDYVNIMSYDLHGAWNQFVGPNAALFDNGEDSELLAWNAYGGAFENIGYLNTDWAFHYFRGSLPAGRINIGVPYYTRGWQGVQGGTNGLWGTASLPDQAQCPPGTGTGNTNKCGYGAVGIDNLWHDKNAVGDEMGAGSNPMWHAKNLENGILGNYLTDYGLDPVNNPTHQLQGNYVRNYNTTMVTPWLWNDQKKVYLSTEDLESINTKADYVINRGIGGIMFWELAGDFDWDANNNQYMMGSSMTRAIADKFATAAPYGNQRAEITLPTEQLDVQVSLRGFALGDNNYPINPELVITNNTGIAIPGGTEFYFDYATSAPASMVDQSGAGLQVVSDGSNAAGNNIGGLENNFHRVKFVLPNSQSIASGAEWVIKVRYYLPVSTPSNWVVKINGVDFAIKQEYPDLPEGDLNSGNGCAAMNIDPLQYNEYPNWPQTDWQGNPTHAAQGDRLRYQNNLFQANWWTSSTPGSDGSWASVCSY